MDTFGDAERVVDWRLVVLFRVKTRAVDDPALFFSDAGSAQAKVDKPVHAKAVDGETTIGIGGGSAKYSGLVPEVPRTEKSPAHVAFFPRDQKGVQLFVGVVDDGPDADAHAGDRLALGIDDSAADHLVFDQPQLNRLSRLHLGQPDKFHPRIVRLGDEITIFIFRDREGEAAVRRRGAEF